jgi:hypothetical protein
MSMLDWNGIGAEMENVADVEIEGGDDPLRADKASAVTDVGDKQALHGRTDFPPSDRTVTITLSRAQWAFVVDELHHSIPIYRSIDMPDAARSAQATIDMIQGQLARATSALAPSPGPTTPARHLARADEHELYLTPFNADLVRERSWPSDRLFGVSRTGAVVLFSGRAFADVDLTVRSLQKPPRALADSLDGWEVGEEQTLRITEPLHGFSPFPEWYAEDVFVPARPGLYRMRVTASGRVRDEAEDYEDIPDNRVTERFEISFWPVTSRAPRERAGSDAVPAGSGQ